MKGLNNALAIIFIVLINGLISCDNQNQQADQNDSLTNKQITSFGDTPGKDTIVVTDTSTPRNAGSHVSADWLLVPGISAGQTRIGENADNVYRRLGTPDGGDAAMQKAVAIWYSQHDSTANSIAIYTARNTDSPAIARVLQIRITSPSFKTKKGIGTTSSYTDVRSKFTLQKTETYKDSGVDYKVYDSKQGIAFEVNDANQCVAIVIHKAGVTGEGTYLKFRTTNKYINK